MLSLPCTVYDRILLCLFLVFLTLFWAFLSFQIHPRTIGASDNSGEDTITVVNIQKFSEESVARKSDYDVEVQRIYFLDEAHRSYKPNGSFLANLMASDRDAVIIALTGTPLIG